MNGPELRIGDDDREAAVTALGEHYAAGRLTKDEYDERSQRAWEARTMSALSPLFADLPRAPAHAPEPSRSTLARHGHPGWWAGARFLPVLVVIGALVVLTHLPVFLLFIALWIFFARSGRHWVHRHHSGRAGRGGWVR